MQMEWAKEFKKRKRQSFDKKEADETQTIEPIDANVQLAAGNDESDADASGKESGGEGHGSTDHGGTKTTMKRPAGKPVGKPVSKGRGNCMR